MERRVTSHTEEEEMNQRRRLLTLARKGDQKSIDLLFELYQVKVFSGDELKKKKLPSFPVLKPSNGLGKGGSKGSKNKEKTVKLSSNASKAKPEAIEKLKFSSSALSKKKTKSETGKASSIKSTKSTLKKSPGVKKASLQKKKSSGKQSQARKVSSAQKPRIAKKK